jgi:hypothetical protein
MGVHTQTAIRELIKKTGLKYVTRPTGCISIPFSTSTGKDVNVRLLAPNPDTAAFSIPIGPMPVKGKRKHLASLLALTAELEYVKTVWMPPDDPGLMVELPIHSLDPRKCEGLVRMLVSLHDGAGTTAERLKESRQYLTAALAVNGMMETARLAGQILDSNYEIVNGAGGLLVVKASVPGVRELKLGCRFTGAAVSIEAGLELPGVLKKRKKLEALVDLNTVVPVIKATCSAPDSATLRYELPVVGPGTFDAVLDGFDQALEALRESDAF